MRHYTAFFIVFVVAIALFLSLPSFMDWQQNQLYIVTVHDAKLFSHGTDIHFYCRCIFFFLTGEYMLLLVNKFQFKITSPLDFLTCEDLCVSLVAGEMFS